jgi:hypothetical protein
VSACAAVGAAASAAVNAAVASPAGRARAALLFVNLFVNVTSRNM